MNKKTFAVKIALPSKTETTKLFFVDVVDEEALARFVEFQFGQFAKVVWSQEVGA